VAVSRPTLPRHARHDERDAARQCAAVRPARVVPSARTTSRPLARLPIGFGAMVADEPRRRRLAPAGEPHGYAGANVSVIDPHDRGKAPPCRRSAAFFITTALPAPLPAQDAGNDEGRGSKPPLSQLWPFPNILRWHDQTRLPRRGDGRYVNPPLRSVGQAIQGILDVLDNELGVAQERSSRVHGRRFAQFIPSNAPAVGTAG